MKNTYLKQRSFPYGMGIYVCMGYSVNYGNGVLRDRVQLSFALSVFYKTNLTQNSVGGTWALNVPIFNKNFIRHEMWIV